MILEVYSVFDSKVGTYFPPFYMRTRGEAIRAFVSTCRDEKSAFAQHPEDYRLFLLGSWDDQTGSFVSLVPVPVIGADEIG